MISREASSGKELLSLGTEKRVREGGEGGRAREGGGGREGEEGRAREGG